MRTVVIGPDAFRVSVMAALEAYCVPHGSSTSVTTHVPLETTGAIWGTRTEDAFGNSIFRVDCIDVDTSAEMQPAAVKQKTAAIALKESFTKKFTPHFEYLGDFHSHPYTEGETVAGIILNTAQKAEHSRLYRFSGTSSPPTSDFGAVETMRKMGLNYRVGLVITVFQLKYAVKHSRRAYIDSKSAIRLTFNGKGLHGSNQTFRIWIKAYVFEDMATVIPAPDKEVVLQCPTAGFYG